MSRREPKPHSNLQRVGRSSTAGCAKRSMAALATDLTTSNGHRPECGLAPIEKTSVPALGFADQARTLVPELVEEIEKLRDALSDLVDTDDCWYDHNGDCQAHGFFDGPCGHAVAKELLAGRE